MSINKYRIRCLTDSKYEFYWGPDPPTLCPVNTAHTIDPLQTTIVDTRDPNTIRIGEETTPTGGHYTCTSISVNAVANATTKQCISFPMRLGITALAVSFTTENVHRGDVVNLFAVHQTLIGAVTANVTKALDWVDSNYVAGDAVVYNARVYTCIANTVANEIPTNLNYWKPGLRLEVTETIIENLNEGYDVFLSLDGQNVVDDVGRALEIDVINRYVYVESNVSADLTAPIFVLMSVRVAQDYEIGPPDKHEFAKTTIGGSHIPRDNDICVTYTNNSAMTAKELHVRLEYLY